MAQLRELACKRRITLRFDQTAGIKNNVGFNGGSIGWLKCIPVLYLGYVDLAIAMQGRLCFRRGIVRLGAEIQERAANHKRNE
ncbi:hypothetical protein D3C85_1600210 [compost metagenome]